MKNTHHTSVLILGGGFTGVAAARELHDRGIDFRLLEAEPKRLGGRVHSFEHAVDGRGSGSATAPAPVNATGHGRAPLVFEGGAQFIGVTQPVIMALVKEHFPEALVDAFAARFQYDDEVAVLCGRRYGYSRKAALFGIGGVPPQMSFWDVLSAMLLIGQIQVIERRVNVVAPWSSPPEILALDGISMADWMQQAFVTPAAADLVAMSVQALLSVEPKDISALYFFWYVASNRGFLNEVNDNEGGPQQYYLSVGFARLVEKLAEPFADRIAHGAAVSSVQMHPPSTAASPPGAKAITVHTKSGDVWHADKLIVAMSPSSAGRIRYSPEPPAARRSLMAQRMGRTVKCQVFYRSPWWRDSHGAHYSGYVGAASSPVIWVMDNTVPGQSDAFCLMTFTVASQAEALGHKLDKARVAKWVTDALCHLFDDTRALAASPEFVDIVFHDWCAERAFIPGRPNTVFEKGLFTGADAPGRLIDEPWDDRVFFASSETARKLDPTSKSAYWTDKDGYPDAREGVGYMDGAILAGRFVAHQALRALGHAGYDHGVDATFAADPPTPAAPQPDAPPAIDRSTILAALSNLSSLVHAAAVPDARGWIASGWANTSSALQDWMAGTVAQAIAMAGLPPDAGGLCAFAQWGSRYATEAAAGLSPEDAKTDGDIRALTAVVGALMALKSAEPFSPSPATP